jgi:hypothetical protein
MNAPIDLTAEEPVVIDLTNDTPAQVPSLFDLSTILFLTSVQQEQQTNFDPYTASFPFHLPKSGGATFDFLATFPNFMPATSLQAIQATVPMPDDEEAEPLELLKKECIELFAQDLSKYFQKAIKANKVYTSSCSLFLRVSHRSLSNRGLAMAHGFIVPSASRELSSKLPYGLAYCRTKGKSLPMVASVLIKQK